MIVRVAVWCLMPRTGWLHAVAALGLAIVTIGCGPVEGRRYISNIGLGDSDHEVLTKERCTSGMDKCREILARDPANKYAQSNLAFFRSRVEAMDKYEADKDAINNWYKELTTTQRVQFDDWIRQYQALRHLGYSSENAAVKSTQAFGRPVRPPLSAPSGDDYFREAFDVLRQNPP